MSTPSPISPISAVRRALVGVLTVILLALPVTAGVWGVDESEDGADSQLAAEVASVLKGARGTDRTSLARGLYDIGPRARGILFSVLERAEGGQGLSATQVHGICDAFALHGEVDSTAFVKKRVMGSKGSAPIRTRLAGLRVIGRCGNHLDVPFVLAVASPPGTEAIPDAMLEGFSWTLTRLFKRDVESLDALARAFHVAPEGLRAPAIRAVGAAGSPEGLPVLTGLLGRFEELDALLLIEIQRLAPGATPDQARVVFSTLAGFLEDGRHATRSSAALALGKLGEPLAIAPLIELLRDEVPGPRRDAHWALQEITGVSLGADHGTWSSWFESERRWFQETAPGLIQKLGSDVPGEIVQAIRGLTRGRLYRREVSKHLVKLLRREEAGIRAMAANGLGSLGCPEAAPPLRALLEDPEDSVRESARRALVAVQAARG